MAITATDFIWQNGQMVPWAEATTHVLSHGLHYGTSIFEGIRAYQTERQGAALFRLDDHIRRLFRSARIYDIAIPYTESELKQACHDVLAVNHLAAAYVRPVAFIGYGHLGLCPPKEAAIEVAIAAFPWGAYLGAEGLSRGIDVGVSSWHRVPPNTVPPMAKISGNYISGKLIAAEAKRHGYDEAIALTPDGYLSEGPGENLFLVKNGTIHTPSLACSILEGVTRETVMVLAAELGYQVREELLPREALYSADELFFTGTAAEVVPIRSVDGMVVGGGQPGPITTRLQQAFFGLFTGATEDRHRWLTTVHSHYALERMHV